MMPVRPHIANKIREELGFTLAEVLVAFVIVSLSMMGIYRAAVVSMQSVVRAEHTETAVSLAKSKLAELSLKRPFELGTFEGRFDDEAFTWSSDITLTEQSKSDSASKALLVQIHLEIALEQPPASSQQAFAYTFETLRLIPRKHFKAGTV